MRMEANALPISQVSTKAIQPTIRREGAKLQEGNRDDGFPPCILCNSDRLR